MRLRRPGEPWLIPVRFDDIEIPDWDVGGGRTLTSIQRADLFADRFDDGAARLVAAVLRILGERSDTEEGAPPRDDLNREAESFLENLQIYLQHLGSMDALLALLPEGIWPIIGASIRMLADKFIQTHDLPERFPVLDASGRLREGIEWQLQTSWIRGYSMYKFYVFDHIPVPDRPVDPKAIMDSVMLPDVPGYPLLAATIPVFLQRAASLSTAPDLVAARLEGFDESITRILVEYLDDWCF